MSPDKPPRVIPGGSKGSSGSSPAGEAKDAAKDAAKKGAKKGGDVAKKTGKKIAEKIVGILKKWLFKKPARYIKLKGKKYLEVSGEKANIVGENSVPTKKRVPSFKGIRKDAGKNTRGARSGSRSLTRGQSPIPEGDVFKRSGGRSRKPRTPTPPKRGRSGVNSKERREKSRRGDRKERNPKQNGSPPRGNDRASPPGQSSTKNNERSGDSNGRKAKLKELKKLPPEEVARAAATDPEARELVMENPSLVDASSKEEAKQKIAIMGGSSPDKAISMGPYSDLDSISSNYGKSWIAVLGYNEMGDGLADAVNDASGKSGGSDSQGDGGKGRSSGRGRGGRGTSSSGSSSAGAGSSGGNGSGVGAGGGSGIAGNGSGLGSSGSGVGTGTGGLGR